MKSFSLLLVLALSFTACAVDQARRGTARGRADALRDLRRGTLAFERCGEPAPWHDTWARLLRERYHIEARWISGTAPDDETFAHSRAYNAIMEPEIARRCGPDVLERSFAEAKRIDPQTN